MNHGSVLLGYLHNNGVSQSFSECLMRLVGHDAANAGRVLRGGGPVMLRSASGNLVQSRNRIAKQFVDDSDAEWLFMVDSDMGFAPDTVDRLVEVASATDRPVVGGLCFGLRQMQPDGYGGFTVRPFPTIYDWGQDHEGTMGFTLRLDYPDNTVTQVAGTGAACLLVHRNAMEKIRADAGDGWFDRVRMTDGALVSEDLSFSYRVNKLGMGMFVHTGVKTTHHKEIWIGEPEYWMFEQHYRALAEEE